MTDPYRIIDPNRVELRKGELRFTSLQPASLVVDTPNASSTAQGTDFLIGHHLADNQPSSADTPNGIDGVSMGSRWGQSMGSVPAVSQNVDGVSMGSMGSVPAVSQNG